MLEATHNGTSAADCWRFHYYVVRDAEKKPILAIALRTQSGKRYFSAAEVSRAIEEERLQDLLPNKSSLRWGRSNRGQSPLYRYAVSVAGCLNMLLQAVRTGKTGQGQYRDFPRAL